MLGTTRTLDNDRGRFLEERKLEPEAITGMEEPLPTMTDFPIFDLRPEVRIPDDDAKWLVAPLSIYQSAAPGSLSVNVLKA